jgi:hypothetical protein
MNEPLLQGTQLRMVHRTPGEWKSLSLGVWTRRSSGQLTKIKIQTNFFLFFFEAILFGKSLLWPKAANNLIAGTCSSTKLTFKIFCKSMTSLIVLTS